MCYIKNKLLLKQKTVTTQKQIQTKASHILAHYIWAVPGAAGCSGAIFVALLIEGGQSGSARTQNIFKQCASLAELLVAYPIGLHLEFYLAARQVIRERLGPCITMVL